MEYLLNDNILSEKVITPKKSLSDTYKYINNKKTWNLKECRIALDNLYQYELEEYEKHDHVSDDKVRFYINYMEHKETELKGFESHLLSLVATIFLPLSFIVGFFGMNFKAMGAPSLPKGIFTDKYMHLHLTLISIASVIFVIWFYYFYLKLI